MLEPQDPAHDAFSFPWMLRYLYDLTQDGTVSLSGGSYGSTTYSAHGALYKAQKYIGGPIYNGLSGGSPTWQDISGTALDALDRPSARYNFQPGGNLVHWSYAYDAAPGMLTNVTTPVGDVITPSYDALARVTSVQYAVAGSVTTPTRTMSYDADSRITQVTSSAFGSMTYNYDSNGLLGYSVESLGGGGIPEFPGSGGWNSQTTLIYHHYPNGWRSGMDVSSSLFTQSNFEQDSYRSDGLPTQRTYTYSGAPYNFNWAYSPAGRLTAKSDPNNSTALTATYDNYGRLQSYGLPEGAYSNFTYDPEGEPTAYTFTASPSNSATTVNLAYSKRGELVANGSGVTMQSADGFLYAGGSSQCYDWGKFSQYHSCGTTAPVFDARTSANLGLHYTPNAGQPTPPPYIVPGAITYDASMRITSGGLTHDADDHDIAESGYNPGFDSNVSGLSAWGPNGHPTVSGLNGANHYLHWNGDQVLYSTTPSGAVDDIKLVSQGDLLPGDASGLLNIWDRDFTGVAVANRNATGHGYTTIWPAGAQCATQIVVTGAPTSGYVAPSADASTCATTGKYVQARVDGYYNGINFVNGVRSYYSGAGSWTSPDALGGTAGDPPSQLTYSYANNNAMMGMDPTGFCPNVSYAANPDGTPASTINYYPCPNWNLTGIVRLYHGFSGGKQGGLWLPCGRDYDSSGDSCQTVNTFYSAHAVISGGASGVMIVCKSVVVSGGAAISLPSGSGFGTYVGAIFAKANQTAMNVATGPSKSLDLAFGGGIMLLWNDSGWGFGMGLGTPYGGGGWTWGTRKKGSGDCNK